jgi:hypothetical protein
VVAELTALRALVLSESGLPAAQASTAAEPAAGTAAGAAPPAAPPGSGAGRAAAERPAAPPAGGGPRAPGAQPPAGPSLEELDSLLAAAHAALALELSRGCPPGRAPAAAGAGAAGCSHGPGSGPAGGGGRSADGGGQSQPGPPAPTLRVRYSSDAGRHLAAARPLSQGTDLLTELPFTAVPMRAARGAVCWRCLAPLQPISGGGGSGSRVPAAPFPCRGCAAALYCSRACRDADAGAAGGHGGECGQPWPLLVPPEAWLAARLVAARRTARGGAGPPVGAPTDGATAQEGGHAAAGGGEGTEGQQQGLTEALVASLPTQPWIRRALGPALGGRGTAAAECAGGAGASGAAGERLRQVALACLLAGVQQQAGAAGGPDAAGGGGGAGRKGAAGGRPAGPAAAAAAEALAALGVAAACGVAARPDSCGGPGDWRGLALYPLTAAVVNHSCDPNCSIRWEPGGGTPRSRAALLQPPQGEAAVVQLRCVAPRQAEGRASTGGGEQGRAQARGASEQPRRGPATKTAPPPPWGCTPARGPGPAGLRGRA